jgi:hypothetical protein
MKLNEIVNISGTELTINDVKNLKELSKMLHVSENELKKYSDEELLTILKNIGVHDFSSTRNVNKTELAKGVKVEKEHTKSELIARLIALDHLNELPDYYSRLEKMENE